MPSFLNRFVSALPGDTSGDLKPRQVQGALWSIVSPSRVSAPRWIAHSAEVAQLLGFDEEVLKSESLLHLLAGNRVPPSLKPYAANYGGHQFGRWAGQLGDGRAIGLGEIQTPTGGLLELQLKGAGTTPYSRGADGRAVLRSSVREFLCSEAMHHLGVPTTRALSLIATGDEVMRDMFYDGHPAAEPGAIVCRVAPSFIRFGNFELCASRGDQALLRALADFTVANFYPQLKVEGYEALYLEVARRTARMIAAWQAVGFVHGVMNTDNMSILGLTIDYGPYGWLEDFDPSWTPNTTDSQWRRYRYGAQPEIGLWNIERLGFALLPLFSGDEAVIERGMEAYQQTFERESAMRFAAKLGLAELKDESDWKLLQELFAYLAAQETDMTLFFRALSKVAVLPRAPETMPAELAAAFYGEIPPQHERTGIEWLAAWWRRVRNEGRPAQRVAEEMNRANPKYVLRNWLAQLAIDAAAQGDDSKIHELLEVLRNPYDEQEGCESFAGKRPEWARSKPGCSALSCSS